MQRSAEDKVTIDARPPPEHVFYDNFRGRRFCILLMIVFTVTCVLAGIFTVIYIVNMNQCQSNNFKIAAIPSAESRDLSSDQSRTQPFDKGMLKIISRRAWLAQPPVRSSEALQHPAPYVIILHTATTNCNTHSECIFTVRQIQTYHVESYRWWDIGYSFLVGGDGSVYEGRGWEKQGAFAYNNVSISIAFVGTFENHLPTSLQIMVGKQLIEKGVELGHVASDYKLLGQSQVSETLSPGTEFFQNLKTWPHWVEEP